MSCNQDWHTAEAGQSTAINFSRPSGRHGLYVNGSTLTSSKVLKRMSSLATDVSLYGQSEVFPFLTPFVYLGVRFCDS